MSKLAIMRVATTMLVALLLLPALVLGQEFSWFINDGPDGSYLWTDTGMGIFWERMGPDEIEAGDIVCTFTDLPVQPEVMAYYACSYEETFDFSGYSFWADLYLSNNYPDHSNPVTVTLGVGSCGDELSFVPVSMPVTVNIVDMDPEFDCGILYRFDFGTIEILDLVAESLILEIVYTGVDYDAHIFWDSECCPSALHCEEGTAARSESWGAVKSLY